MCGAEHCPSRGGKDENPQGRVRRKSADTKILKNALIVFEIFIMHDFLLSISAGQGGARPAFRF